MFDFMQMAGTPQSQEMFFRMMSQQMSQSPPDVREAIAKVEVVIKKGERGFEMNIGKSDHDKVEEMVRQSLDSWINLLSRGFQAVGYRVKIYE
jgi:hypothetical protein